MHQPGPEGRPPPEDRPRRQPAREGPHRPAWPRWSRRPSPWLHVRPAQPHLHLRRRQPADLNRAPQSRSAPTPASSPAGVPSTILDSPSSVAMKGLSGLRISWRGRPEAGRTIHASVKGTYRPGTRSAGGRHGGQHGPASPMTAYRTACGASARPRAEYVTGAWVEPEAVLAGKAPDGRARRGSGRSSAGHWPASSGASRARAGGAGPQSEARPAGADPPRAPEEVAAGPAADPLAGRPGVALDGRPDGDGPRLGDRLAQRPALPAPGALPPRRGAALAAGFVFLFSGVSVYAVVLPQVGVHAPGQNTLHKLLNRVPGLVPTARRTSPRLRGPRGPASRCRRRTTRTPDSLRTTWAGRGVSPG